MPSCSPERRSSRVITGGRRIGALVMIAAFAAAALAGPADASKISDTRAQVRAIEQQLNAMDIKLEASIQAYDGAQQHLTDVRHQIAQNTIKLRVAKHNLKVSRAQLAVFMVNAYKGTDVNDDPAAYVLGAGSFSDLITRVEDVQRIGALGACAAEAGDDGRARDLDPPGAAEERGARRRQAGRPEAAAEGGHRGRAAAAPRASVQHQGRARPPAPRAPGAPAAGGRGGRRRAGSAATAAAGAAGPAALERRRRHRLIRGRLLGRRRQLQPAPAGTLGQQAAAIAQQYLGVPYVWGGASPSGFDCSGLVVYVYGRLGVSLPHYTVSLWSSGAHVSRDQLAPGDLVFFYSLDHVGIYLGGGLFIHAPHTGTVVQISSLNSSWYSSAYDGAVRISG